jgi:dipeptidyl aminopeptidase/acylaminoacyl peptidase
MAQAARLLRRPTLVPIAVVAGVGALIVTGCGPSTPDSTADNPAGGPAGSPAGGFRVTYKLTSTTGEQNFDKLDVLTDGRAKVRTTIGIFGTKGEAGRVVSDGSRAVVLSPADNGRYGAGSSYADMKVSEVQHYVLHDGDASLAAWCADAKPAGTAQVLGRSARHYTCKDPGIEQLERAKELWVDQQTGLILKWKVGSGGHDFTTATAIGIDVHARLPADAFSLRPAPGATPEKSP